MSAKLNQLGIGATSALALIAGLGAGPAAAQTVFEEILVTAQKRVESLTDVPVAMTVLNANQIERSFSDNIETLQALVPSLTFLKGGTNLNSSLFLRGVGTINFSTAAEPSVAFVVDGVVFARAGEAFSDLYDIERIEVLRGPQGTLFGKNTSAGAVSIVTKKPTEEFGGYLSVSAFEDDEYRAKAMINIPLSDKVRTRWTGTYGYFDGHITNLFSSVPGGRPTKIQGYERQAVRGVIDIDASSDLKLSISADYRDSNDDCCGDIIATEPTGANAAAVRQILAGVDFRGDKTREVSNDLTTRTLDEAWGVSLTADYTIANHVLTSITAYREWDNTEIREGDFTGAVTPAFVGNAFARLHDNSVAGSGKQDASTFTQELRLTSPGGQFIDYMVGLYYYDADAQRNFRRDVTVCTATTLAVDPATGLAPCQPGFSTFVTDFSFADFGSEFENFAAFGNATVNISDTLRVIGGLRWTRDEVSFTHERVGATIGLPGIRTDGSGFADKETNNNLSGKAGLQFDVNDDTMVYGTYTRGYKGPAFNVFFNQNPSQLDPIDAETADAFEIGSKSVLFDDKLIFNAAIFYAKYSNFQANNFDTLNGVVITRLTNAGKVSTKGLEIDFLARPTENFSLNGGLAYTDAQIENFLVPPGSPPTATDLSGRGLPFSPDWKASLSGEYVVPLESLPVNLVLNSQFTYQSSQSAGLPTNPTNEAVDEALIIGGYALWDASINLVSKEEKYSFSLIVKNILDESFASTITPGGPAGTFRFQIPREASRFFGVNLKVNFGG